MRYPIVIERSDTGFSAYALDLPGVGVVGESADEVRELIKEAIAFHLEGLRADGQPIPKPSGEIDYIYFDSAT